MTLWKEDATLDVCEDDVSCVQSTKRSKALKERVEGRRAVDPWEIDELRLANDQVDHGSETPVSPPFHNTAISSPFISPTGACSPFSLLSAPLAVCPPWAWSCVVCSC
jgi:hypothetical protein